MLSLNEMKRYARHLILPNFGAKEQRKLKASKVIVTGAGGIGSPLLLYLAAVGVGNIIIIDSDKVEASNLNRQILYKTSDIGKPKARIACERLSEFNPEIKLDYIEERITYENAFDLLKDAHAIADGTDNFAARYSINDAAMKNRIPLFHAAAVRYEGRAFTAIPQQSACLRCIFPNIPPEGVIPTCREAGILGAVVGVVASVQAIEVIKHLAGLGASLLNRVLIFDARDMIFDYFKVKRNPNCTACGEVFKPAPITGGEVCEID